MANPLTLQRSQQGDVTVLTVDGFLDAHTAPQFERALQDEIAAGHVKLAVDCARLTYISSAGLGVFMGFIEEVRESKGDIKICGLTPKVRQVFEILGFEGIYDLLETVPAALERFAADDKTPREAR
jgi:anti-sigma B factor antagonist